MIMFETALGLTALVAALAFLFAAGAAGLLVRAFAAPDMLDVPNGRSSHTRPTPRGGGLATALAAALGWLALDRLGVMSIVASLTFGLAGSAIATVGFLDDRRLVSLGYRLAFHIVAAGLCVTLLGGLPPLPLGGATIDLGLAGDVLAVLFLVWSVNLFNFMDGIDALAGSQALIVTGGAAALAAAGGFAGAHLAAPLVLCGAIAGFLVWNLPPAKIFMGSVGSEFLGFCIGLTALSLAQIDPRLFWTNFILMAALASDATMTLSMRLLAKDNVLNAHRTHAYQLLALKHGHGAASLAYALVQLCYLAPIAALVAFGRLDGLIGALIAYAPLCAFVIFYRRSALSAQTQAET